MRFLILFVLTMALMAAPVSSMNTLLGNTSEGSSRYNEFKDLFTGESGTTSEKDLQDQLKSQAPEEEGSVVLAQNPGFVPRTSSSLDYIDFEESEPNDSPELANLVHGDYYGQVNYAIIGYINSDDDLDGYKIEVTAPGKFEISGYWIGDYYCLGREDDLLFFLTDEDSFLEVSVLAGLTLEELHQYMSVDVVPGTYYLVVLQISEYADLYTGEPYALEVVFEPVTHAVSLSANPSGGGSVAGAGSYVEGKDVNVTASPFAGYSFISWTEGSNIVSTKPAYSFKIQSPRNLTANFYWEADIDWIDRIFGSSRYDTAVEISKEGWPAGAGTVLLARGNDYADALAGVPLAYQLDAPILLSATGSLPEATQTEIQRLNATRVIILGGTNAISDDVKETLDGMGLVTERIAGPGRYETAILIAQRLAAEGTGFDTAFIAVGTSFPDALSASSYAAIRGFPILLTQKGILPDATSTFLEGIDNTFVIGGENAITNEVFSQLPNPERVFGNNRFATSVSLAERFLSPDTRHIYVATGMNFPDAVAGGVLAAKPNSGVLLVLGNRSEPNQEVQDFIALKGISAVTLFGGSSVVSSDIEDWFKAHLAPYK